MDPYRQRTPADDVQLLQTRGPYKQGSIQTGLLQKKGHSIQGNPVDTAIPTDKGDNISITARSLKFPENNPFYNIWLFTEH